MPGLVSVGVLLASQASLLGGLFGGGGKDGGGGGGGALKPSEIDKKLLAQDFFDHGYFTPASGHFADSAGEQAACVLDKGLHLIQFSLCEPGTRLRRYKKSYKNDCDARFLDDSLIALKECCSGIARLPSWASSHRCRKTTAPAVAKLKALAGAFQTCRSHVHAHGPGYRWAIGNSKDPGCAAIYTELGAPLQSAAYAAIYTAAKGLYGYTTAQPEGARKFLEECAPHKDDTYECNAITQAVWDQLAAARRRKFAHDEARNKKWAQQDAVSAKAAACPEGYTFRKWRMGKRDISCPQTHVRGKCVVPKKAAASICRQLGAECTTVDQPLDLEWSTRHAGLVMLRGGPVVTDGESTWNSCAKGAEKVLKHCPGMTCTDAQKGALCKPKDGKFYRCCNGLWRDGKVSCRVD